MKLSLIFLQTDGATLCAAAAVDYFGATSSPDRWKECSEEAERHGSWGHVAGWSLHHVDGGIQGLSAHAWMGSGGRPRSRAENRVG